MIRDFRNRRLKRLFERGERSKIDSQMVDKVERILARLDVADTPEAMRLPGFRLHELRGNLGGLLVSHGESQLAHHFSL